MFYKKQVIKCVKKGIFVDYLTVDKEYVITAGMGDEGDWGYVSTGFEISDDDNDSIFQNGLSGRHGVFEVVS